MGFMIASKLSLNEEEFKKLSEEEKATFKRTKKGKKVLYEKNITKKRKARLMVSPLQAISSTRIQREFNTRVTDATNIIYTREVYSNIMSMGFNLDIKNVGIYTVSEDESGFRDYSPEEIEVFGLDVDENGIIELDKEKKKKRIIDTLRGIQHFNTGIAQSNNLEDLNTKFVIMADYSIGNNIFNNIFRNGTLDIDYLIEAIEENEEFRQSKVYIGVRHGFMKLGDKDLREVLEETFEDNDDILVGTVSNAFNGYVENLN